MKGITLQEIYIAVMFIGSFVGGIAALINYFKKFIVGILHEEIKLINDQMLAIHNSLEGIKEEARELGINDTKNFLTVELTRLKNGEKMSEGEKAWIHHNFDIYTEKYKKNSYIQDEFNELRRQGKL